jgi:hypothetical protein
MGSIGRWSNSGSGRVGKRCSVRTTDIDARAAPELRLLPRWLDCRRGVADVVTRMNRQGYLLHLPKRGRWDGAGDALFERPDRCATSVATVRFTVAGVHGRAKKPRRSTSLSSVAARSPSSRPTSSV